MNRQETENCKTCEMRAQKKCFLCANYDNSMYCSEVCGYSKKGFETEVQICPECGREWEE